MNDYYERLQQFFSGYFNQDWNAEGASGWVDVLNQFAKAHPKEDVIQLRDDLMSWLSDHDELDSLPEDFGCDFDPSRQGLDDRSWVLAIVEQFGSLIADWREVPSSHNRPLR